MNNYERLRITEFFDLLKECEQEFYDWNPRKLDKLKAFLEADPSCINETCTIINQVWVHLGIRTRDNALTHLFMENERSKCPLELVKLLVDMGVNVNYWHNYERMSPLQCASVMDSGFKIFQLLLFSGARIGAMSELKKDNLILRTALSRFLENQTQKEHEELKLFVKYFYLEDPDFEIELFIQRNAKSQRPQLTELVRLANECSHQVKVMKAKDISLNSSLYYFVKRRLSQRRLTTGDKPPLSSTDFIRLINIMADNDISQYQELIAHLVGVDAMIANLEKLQLYYTITDCSDLNETILLSYYCLLDIVRHLSAADVLGLFITSVLNNMHKDTKSTQYAVKNLNKRQKI